MRKNIFNLIILIILAVCLSNTGAWSSSSAPSDGVQLEERQAEDTAPRYNLRVFIKVHKVLFEQDEPVFVRFLIKNQESVPVELKISDEFFLNFSFVVKNLQNQIIGQRNSFYLHKLSNNENRSYRTIKLAPGDIYGKTIDLRKLFVIDDVGYYIVHGVFYPVPFGFHDVNDYPSNRVKIQIRYNARREAAARATENRERRELDVIRSPYDTVAFLLDAKMKKKWEHFFHYIDLDRLIEIYPDYHTKYLNVGSSKRRAVLSKFRAYLKTYLDEEMSSFDIYKTVINRDDAKVYCNIIYSHRGTKFKKRYVFSMYKRGSTWYMYHYYVMNLRLTREELEQERRGGDASRPRYD